MRKKWKHHTAADIIAKLDAVSAQIVLGVSVSDAAASVGVSDATYFRWRKRYGGLRANQLQYIKELEAEVARLRKAIDDFESASA